MAPVKFDDFSKVANEVLSDDYQVTGYVFKTKQKTSWTNAVFSSQVDLFAGANCATPAKLTWKLPKPFGFGYFSFDKLEMDKAGKFKLEASSDQLYQDLKVECKSDLADVSKIMIGATYTGVKNAQLKIEHKATKPQDFTGEATYSAGCATVGVKFSSAVLSGGLPDFGVRVLHGAFFGSLTAKDKLSTFNAHLFYKACPDAKIAATYQHGGKGAGAATVGLVYKNLYKLKVSQDQSVCCSVKHSLAKGFTITKGFKYNIKKGDYSYGAQLSIE